LEVTVPKVLDAIDQGTWRDIDDRDRGYLTDHSIRVCRI